MARTSLKGLDLALADCDAEISSVVVGGQRIQMLCFSLFGEHFAIPFGAGPHHEIRVHADGTPLDRPFLVWSLVSGSTIHDLTLAPSYLVHEVDMDGKRVGERLHGHVRGGRWISC